MGFSKATFFNQRQLRQVLIRRDRLPSLFVCLSVSKSKTPNITTPMDANEFIGIEDPGDDLSSLEQYALLAEEAPTEVDGDLLPSSMKPVVRNLVACADFGVEFNLLNIAQTVRNAEYNPRRFPAVILRITEPKATALIFKKGNMNIVGTSNQEDAHLAARKFGKIMRKLKYKVKLISFSIKNIVATAACNFKVGLEQIANNPSFRSISNYNPEIFSGLVYKIPKPKVTLLIFASGKIILTGAKTLQELDDAAEWIMPILQLNQKSEMPNPTLLPDPGSAAQNGNEANGENNNYNNNNNNNTSNNNANGQETKTKSDNAGGEKKKPKYKIDPFRKKKPSK